MGKKSSCAMAGAWITLVVLLLILIIFFILSTLFDLRVWDELLYWLFGPETTSAGG